LVDDGSTDASWQEILNQIAARKNVSLVGVRLLRNVGQMKALDEGIKLSKGQWILTMDSDLQHPPSFIQKMWAERTNADIVSTRQISRQDSFYKKILSKLFYICIKTISGIRIQNNVGDFRLMNRKVVNDLLSLNIHSKSYRFLIAREGYRAVVLDFQADERKFGSSKYSIRKMLNLGMNSIISTTTKPLKLGGYFAVLFGMLSIAEFFYITYVFLFGSAVPGWASIAILMTTSFFVVFLNLYFIGAYLAAFMSNFENKNRRSVGTVIDYDDL
jgi:dolichol-phosphate mannosyltransferase